MSIYGRMSELLAENNRLTAEVEWRTAQRNELLHMHDVPDPQTPGFCQECSKPYPCPTARALGVVAAGEPSMMEELRKRMSGLLPDLQREAAKVRPGYIGDPRG